MKYCSHCGKQLDDAAVICPGCGCAVNNTPSNNAPQTNAAQMPISSAEVIVEGEKPLIARLAVAFTFLLPIVGLILGIIGVIKYKTEKFKKQCIIAISISVVFMIFNFIFIINNF